MSGFLRRNQRSRTTAAGGTSAEGRAAGPEGAPAAETPAGDSSSATTSELAAATRAEAPGATAEIPAGLDPAQAAAPATTGRRGRLRRRLRYLRRARELMLRDLGGLLYEIHRTGGGDIAANTGTIAAKVERLAGLDAEATAIETALAAPRAQTVVFEPGIGGTCDVCGELYGSSARYCSQCGSAVAATTAAVPAVPAVPAEPRPVPAMPKPPASPAADGGSEPATDTTPAARAAAAAREPAQDTLLDPGDAADEQPTGKIPSPSAETSNGRADAGTAPGLAPADPLAGKESHK
jgi:hypothetical protein